MYLFTFTIKKLFRKLYEIYGIVYETWFLNKFLQQSSVDLTQSEEFLFKETNCSKMLYFKPFRMHPCLFS
jgi:hypothetical protein